MKLTKVHWRMTKDGDMYTTNVPDRTIFISPSYHLEDEDWVFKMTAQKHDETPFEATIEVGSWASIMYTLKRYIVDL